MHPDRNALVRAIEANPRDYLTRKIYADWLDEYTDEAEEASKQRRWNDECQDAWEWLVEVASTSGTHRDRPITIEDLLNAGHMWLDTLNHKWGPEYWTQDGDEGLRDRFSDDHQVSLFWKNWSLVTGRGDPGPNHRGEHPFTSAPFSCSC